jgi:hypothetical protein
MDTTNATPQPFRPLDTRIPFLATRAAVQLDNLIARKNKSVEAIERLGASLSETADATAGAVAKKRLVDPFAVRILRMAGQPLTKEASADELVRQAKEKASKLTAAAAGKATKDDLRMLRAYCLALSRALSSFHQTRQDHLKPLHRIRR